MTPVKSEVLTLYSSAEVADVVGGCRRSCDVVDLIAVGIDDGLQRRLR